MINALWKDVKEESMPLEILRIIICHGNHDTDEKRLAD